MSEEVAGAGHAGRLREQVEHFLNSRRRENVSANTLRAYAADLRQFLGYMELNTGKLDLLLLRGWLADLYDQNLSPVSMRRKVAALRSFLRFLVREGVVATNTARLLATPKAPRKIPRVMTAEQTNNLLDAVPTREERPQLARDVAILELLSGCGIRVSELAGLNLEDID